jgi:hypothetical protein
MTTGPDGAGDLDPRLAGPAGVLAVVGALEAALAWLALRVGAEGATCPDLGPAFGCAAIVRPRVSGLVGPLTVTHLAWLGALATIGLGLFLLVAARDRSAALPRLARFSALALGLGAGAALGLQPLGWLGGGVVCPLCLALAALALGAFAAGLVAAGRAGCSRRAPLVAFSLALLLTAPLATARGRSLADEDAVRIAAAEAFLRAPRERPGPRLVVVLREDCAYCRGLLADVLSDPRVQAALEPVGAIDVWGSTDVRARALGVAGPPTLAVLGRDGQLRGALLEGYHGDPAAYAAALAARLR